MSFGFVLLTIIFIVVSAAMVLIILVQRPSGGGLAGAFGGAGGGSGTETVFGGRVGDALTVMTVIAFVLYLGLAVGLNLMDTSPAVAATQPAGTTATELPAGVPGDPVTGSGLPPAGSAPVAPGSSQSNPIPVQINPDGTLTPTTPPASPAGQ